MQHAFSAGQQAEFALSLRSCLQTWATATRCPPLRRRHRRLRRARCPTAPAACPAMPPVCAPRRYPALAAMPTSPAAARSTMNVARLGRVVTAATVGQACSSTMRSNSATGQVGAARHRSMLPAGQCCHPLPCSSMFVQQASFAAENVQCTTEPEATPSPPPPGGGSNSSSSGDGGTGTGVARYLSSSLWSTIFRNINNFACTGAGFYTYEAFIAGTSTCSLCMVWSTAGACVHWRPHHLVPPQTSAHHSRPCAMCSNQGIPTICQHSG